MVIMVKVPERKATQRDVEADDQGWVSLGKGFENGILKNATLSLRLDLSHKPTICVKQ